MNENLQIVLTALQAIMVAAIPAYFIWRGKRDETQPDLERAHTNLQVELARAAENMVEPLNRRIELQSAELNLLRSLARKQTQDIALLTQQLETLRTDNEAKSIEISIMQGDVVQLRTENEDLRAQMKTLEGKLSYERKRTATLQQRLKEIKSAVETGTLRDPNDEK